MSKETKAQELARTVNWTLFQLAGALGNIPMCRYRLHVLREKLQYQLPLLTAEESRELLCALQNLDAAKIHLTLAQTQLRMFNVLRSKNHE